MDENGRLQKKSSWVVFNNFVQPVPMEHTSERWDVACVAGAKRGGRGGRRKARKRGKGRERHPFPSLPYPPPFFPIPYPFRRLLRRLDGTCRERTLGTSLRSTSLVHL